MHSASIPTADVSIPSGTSSTLSKGTSSPASTSSTSMLKRLPPASSIISSFFPNCQSKRPGRAVPVNSPIDRDAIGKSSECLKTEYDTKSLSKHKSACHENLADNGDETVVDHLSVSMEKSDCQLLCQLSEDNCSLKQASRTETGSIKISKCDSHRKKKESFILGLDLYKTSQAEKDGEGSDDEFEDCNSVISDPRSNVLGSSEKLDEESESLSDEWSDAEDDLDHPYSLNQPTNDRYQSSVSDNSCTIPMPQQIESNSLQEADSNCSMKDCKVATIEKQRNEEREKLCGCLSEVACTSSCGKDNQGRRPDQAYNNLYFEEQNAKTIRETAKAEHLVNESSHNFPCSSPRKIVDEEIKKTDKEVCAHGVDMASLCLLCLGYASFNSRQSLDCTLRLKPNQTATKVSEDSSKQTMSPSIALSASDCGKVSPPCCSRSDQRIHATDDHPIDFAHTVSHRHKSVNNCKQKQDMLPPQKILPDGTVIYYWCDVPGGFTEKSENGMFVCFWQEALEIKICFRSLVLIECRI